jgi:hypothetical protein
MAATVTCFVSLKMFERLGSTRWHRSSVTMTRIVAVIDVAVEAARAVEPWTGSNERPADKPVRPIVTVRSAVIGRVVKVAVGAYRSNSDVDVNLRGCDGSGTGDQCGSQCGKCEYLADGHMFILLDRHLRPKK